MNKGLRLKAPVSPCTFLQNRLPTQHLNSRIFYHIWQENIAGGSSLVTIESKSGTKRSFLCRVLCSVIFRGDFHVCVLRPSGCGKSCSLLYFLLFYGQRKRELYFPLLNCFAKLHVKISLYAMFHFMGDKNIAIGHCKGWLLFTAAREKRDVSKVVMRCWREI